MNYWPAIVAALVVLNMVADVAARASQPWIAIVVYALCGVAWAVLLGRPGASLVRMVAVYGVLTYVFGAAAGAWFFNERLSPSNWAGLALGLVALLLIGH